MLLLLLLLLGVGTSALLRGYKVAERAARAECSTSTGQERLPRRERSRQVARPRRASAAHANARVGQREQLGPTARGSRERAERGVAHAGGGGGGGDVVLVLEQHRRTCVSEEGVHRVCTGCEQSTVSRKRV